MLRWGGQSLEGIAFEEAMVEHPVTVDSDASMATALSLFSKRRRDSLLVVEDGNRLIGILTRADIVRTMVRLVGLEVDGRCVAVSLVDANSNLGQAFEAVRESGAELISAIAACCRDDGDEPALYLRTRDSSPQRLERALSRAVLILLDP